jgi:hypothetical protein
MFEFKLNFISQVVRIIRTQPPSETEKGRRKLVRGVKCCII